MYIDSLGSASNDREYSTHKQADLNYKGQRSEQLHQININKCDLTVEEGYRLTVKPNPVAHQL